MRLLVTIDGGTTNTRAALWNESGACLGVEREEIGVRDTAVDGGNARLKTGVRACLNRLLATGAASPGQVAAVYASGMITSNVGLVEVPHLAAPAAREDFLRAIHTVHLPDVFPVPFSFVPGLKNLAGDVAPADLEAMDIMRGEETEALALQEWFPAGREHLFVLPGSHSKFVAVDREGRLTGCLTSLAGELLAILTERSILADAVRRRFVSEGEYDRDRVLAGGRTARKTSLSRAAFSTRIMSLFVADSPVACANFLLGAVLQGDVDAAKGSAALSLDAGANVVVAGRQPLRRALVDIFTDDGFFRNVSGFDVPGDAPLAARGAFGLAVQHGAFA